MPGIREKIEKRRDNGEQDSYLDCLLPWDCRFEEVAKQR
jgi:hypothetical protein